MNLRTQVLAGLAWSGGVRLVSQVVTWAITIAVIRILSPMDYGLLAMATVFSNFLVLLSEAGLGAAVIQAPRTDDAKLRQIFGAVIVVDSVLCAAQFAAAPLIASFFGEQRLVWMVRVLALQFLLMIFTTIPLALLSKALDFKQQSIVELVAAVCASIATLALALAGYGVWAIVAGTMLGQVYKTVAINVVRPYLALPRFSLAGLRDLLAFGGQVTAARVCWFLYSQADIFIAGKLLGKELLGSYSVAMHLASLPVQKISSVMNQVAFPAFAHAQQRPQSVPEYLLKAVRVISLVSFPIFWGISSVSQEIVQVLLGERWSSAIVPLHLLPLVMPFTMLSPLFNSAFQGIGKAGVVLANTLTLAVVMPGAFLLGVHWGITGLCVAWLTAFPLVFIVNLARMLPLVNLSLRDVIGAVAPAIACSAIMYAAVAISRAFGEARLSSFAGLGVLVGAGVLAYCAASVIFNKRSVQEMIGFVAPQHRLAGRT